MSDPLRPLWRDVPIRFLLVDADGFTRKGNGERGHRVGRGIYRSSRWHGQDECCHCGAITELQEHHIAPRSVFDDAVLWPSVLLCVHCHRLWHSKMRGRNEQ